MSTKNATAILLFTISAAFLLGASTSSSSSDHDHEFGRRLLHRDDNGSKHRQIKKNPVLLHVIDTRHRRLEAWDSTWSSPFLKETKAGKGTK